MVTPCCNLACSYCGGDLHGMPKTISYDRKILADIISKDTHAVVAFYGGEPLLQPDIVKDLIKYLKADHFVINTNGYYIRSIEDILGCFDTILLSIDGRKESTDYYRGVGCYHKVLDALEVIQGSDFSGELIARMTISHKSDIFLDVKHLLALFPFVHWQIDVVWSRLWGLSEFKQWVESSYKPGLKKLISWWISEIQEERIHGIIPFLGIMSRLLHGGGYLPCQAGSGSIAISTEGKILACPIAPESLWNNLGDISSGFQKIYVDEPCPSCDVYPICGGRCLFANKERLWGKEGFEAICDMTRFLINELQHAVSICEPYKDRIVYPPYNNTTEIIP